MEEAAGAVGIRFRRVLDHPHRHRGRNERLHFVASTLTLDLATESSRQYPSLYLNILYYGKVIMSLTTCEFHVTFHVVYELCMRELREARGHPPENIEGIHYPN